MSKQLENQLFNLKFTSKQMQRQSKKCEKDIGKEKLRLKKAIEKGNVEGARIYAQNAIRQKNMAANYLRLSSRVDAVAARLDTAIKMQMVTGSMKGVVVGMDRALESMDLQQISAVMDKFEKQFEDMDVAAEYVEGAITESTAMATPQGEVDSLIQQVADEHGIEMSHQLNVPGAQVEGAADPVKAKEKDPLADRLNQLKG